MPPDGTATIDTGSNWVTMTGRVYGGLGTTFNKIGSGAFYVNYGMGNSGFLGNVNIQAGSMVDCGVGFGTETDAFGDSTVVTVAAGATWDDSWGNGENLGGISGAGTILAPTASLSGWRRLFQPPFPARSTVRSIAWCKGQGLGRQRSFKTAAGRSR